MKALRQQLVCIAVCGLMAFTMAAAAAAPPATAALAPSTKDAASQRVLAAMSRSSTYGHPDEYGEFKGMRRYAAGDYKAAMKYFLIGARYADKLSQLSIGLMYLNGRGVQKDPVRAFAWIAIAAERKYPAFLATRDRVWGQLDATQREQSRHLLDDLYPEYGDPTAKRRMTVRLRWALADAAGTGLGYDHSGAVNTRTPGQFNNTGPEPACGAETIGGSPITGCDDTYVAWRWNPKKYFAARDSAWKGTVTVGTVEQGALDAKGKVPESKKPESKKP